LTIVIGYRFENRLFMGADSLGSDGHHHAVRTDPKIYRNGKLLIGFTTSYRMGQLLCFSVKIPPLDRSGDDFAWMIRRFIPAVRKTFIANGFESKRVGGEAYAGSFLVAFRNRGEARLYEVDSDYQVAEIDNGPYAIGCGSQVALGAMDGLRDSCVNIGERISKAIDICARHCQGIGGPTIIKEYD
jgi:ATP-dependent protease HslVU (ClpYQ) peptidase subunit